MFFFNRKNWLHSFLLPYAQIRGNIYRVPFVSLPFRASLFLGQKFHSHFPCYDCVHRNNHDTPRVISPISDPLVIKWNQSFRKENACKNIYITPVFSSAENLLFHHRETDEIFRGGRKFQNDWKQTRGGDYPFQFLISFERRKRDREESREERQRGRRESKKEKVGARRKGGSFGVSVWFHCAQSCHEASIGNANFRVKCSQVRGRDRSEDFEATGEFNGDR